MFDFFSSSEPFALLDHHRPLEEGSSHLFFDWQEDFICHTKAEIDAVFQKLPALQAKGLYTVILASYELGAYFLPSLPLLAQKDRTFPLLQVLVFKRHQMLSLEETDVFLDQLAASIMIEKTDVSSLEFETTEEEYVEGIERIVEHLRQGDTYQVNYTLKAHAKLNGNPLTLFQRLRQNQRVAYGAFIQHRQYTILSFSPELFLKKEGTHLWSKPMKGTIVRAPSFEADMQQAEFLRQDEKNRAENLIIVDLIRNDLSKIAKLHSIRVSDLFKTERYETLWQMTSTVHATVERDIPLSSVFQALFPCGSITGAPKVRTMKIIQACEKTPRGLYTGSIGYLLPDHDFCFSVAIRTLVYCKETGMLTLGLGSGITIHSDPHAEYEETLLKAAFLKHINRPFDLYESLALNEGQIVNMAGHLERLEKSALYFGFRYVQQDCEQALLDLALKHPRGFFKAKLLLSRHGQVVAEAETLKYTDAAPIVFLSPDVMDSQNPLLYHKTTLKDHYERPFQELHEKTRCMDIIFYNERGEITEGSYNNVVILKDGLYYTPPISSGLLAGLGRKAMMDSKLYQLKEKILTAQDLRDADALYLLTSLRGLRAVTLLPTPQVESWKYPNTILSPSLEKISDVIVN